MRDIEVSLRIKYKLPQVPDELEAARWTDRTEELIRQGIHPEEAGSQAASEIFPGCGTYLLKAEADTIEALLERARKK